MAVVSLLNRLGTGSTENLKCCSVGVFPRKNSDNIVRLNDRITVRREFLVVSLDTDDERIIVQNASITRFFEAMACDWSLGSDG